MNHSSRLNRLRILDSLLFYSGTYRTNFELFPIIEETESKRKRERALMLSLSNDIFSYFNNSNLQLSSVKMFSTILKSIL